MSEGQHWAKQCPQLTLQDRARQEKHRLLIYTLLPYLYIFSALQLFQIVPVAQLKTAAAAGVSWHDFVYNSQKS